jgi:hypothetical protein
MNSNITLALCFIVSPLLQPCRDAAPFLQTVSTQTVSRDCGAETVVQRKIHRLAAESLAARLSAVAEKRCGGNVHRAHRTTPHHTIPPQHTTQHRNHLPLDSPVTPYFFLSTPTRAPCSRRRLEPCSNVRHNHLALLWRLTQNPVQCVVHLVRTLVHRGGGHLHEPLSGSA